MDPILFIRIVITLTFLILAICGPIAIYMLRKFIKVYMVSQAALTARVTVLEKALHLPTEEPPQ